MKKLRYILAIATVLTVLCSLTAQAAVSHSLLNEGMTALSSNKTGMFSYTPQGGLSVQCINAQGVTASVDLAMPIQIDQTPYLQLSVKSTTSFNVALKLSGTEHAAFPQLAGPSWYEAFQKDAPADGKGVAAGHYTLSLDLRSYLKYNDLPMPQDSTVTLETVFVMLDDVGELTVEHLAISDQGDFQTVLGTTGTTASSPIVITTASHGSTRATVPTYDAGGVTRYQNDEMPWGIIAVLVVAALAVVAMVLLTVLKPRREADEAPAAATESAEVTPEETAPEEETPPEAEEPPEDASAAQEDDHAVMQEDASVSDETAE